MTRRIKISIASLFALILATLIIIPITACSTTTTALDKYFDLEFHRGGRGEMPENTLYAYTYAIENGATTIEGDMQMTKDGVIVMSHSPILEPSITQDKNGNFITSEIDIRTLTYDEVEQYNVGHIDKNSNYYQLFGATQQEVDAKIPTLEELFQLVKDSGNKEIMMNLETKIYPDPQLGILYQNNVNAETLVTKVLDLATKYGMENRLIIQSFDWSVFPIVKSINPNVLCSALWDEAAVAEYDRHTLWLDVPEASPWLGGYNIHDFGDNAVDIAFALGCDIISPEIDQVATIQIMQAHDYDMKVVPWTANTIDDMQKAWDMECDGFITDYGSMGRKFLQDQEAAIPKTQKINSPYHIDTK